MKMNKIAAAALVTLSLASASAMAGTQVVDLSKLATTATNFETTLSFAGFNSSLGSLTGVTIDLYSLVDSTATLVNYNDIAVQGTASLNATLALNLLSKSATTASSTANLYNTTLTLAEADTVGDMKTTGGTLTLHVTQSVSSGLDAYLSATPLSAYVTETAQSSFKGADDVWAKFRTTGTAYGTVTYTYAAAPVPEPETYAMLLAGIGLVGMMARRKRAARQA